MSTLKQPNTADQAELVTRYPGSGSGGDGGNYTVGPTKTDPWRCQYCRQSPADDVFPLLIGVLFVGLPTSFLLGILFAFWKIKVQP